LAKSGLRHGKRQRTAIEAFAKREKWEVVEEPYDAEWPAKIVATKHHCVEAASQVVDRAMDLSGGTGVFKTNRLERLFRNARCG